MQLSTCTLKFRWKCEITIVFERCALSFFSPLVVGMQGSCVHALLPSVKQSRPASNLSRFIFLYIEYHYRIHSTLKLIGIISDSSPNSGRILKLIRFIEGSLALHNSASHSSSLIKVSLRVLHWTCSHSS